MIDAERIAAYESAVAHPFHVHAYTDWADHDGTHVGFQTEAEARSFASMRPEPLIDLVQRESGRVRPGGDVIASRRLVPHPLAHDRMFVPHDDFPDTRS